MNKRFAISLPIAIVGALALVSSAQAQRRFAAPAPAARTATVGRYRPTLRTALPLSGRNRFFSRSRFLPYPYLYPSYFSPDYDSEPVMTEAPAPQVVVIEAAPASAQTPAPSPPEPLLLELQGDQWVRVPSYTQAPAGAPSAPPESLTASGPRSVAPRQSIAAEPPRELPPAVLVFRDGHEEEVKSYTIIDKTLYTSANYWTTGSWTRKIEINDLDVPATLKLNQERGSNFRLPSGPQEVVIRL